MSNNNQTKDIYSIADVEDLSHDTAANIQGGKGFPLTVYPPPAPELERLAALLISSSVM